MKYYIENFTSIHLGHIMVMLLVNTDYLLGPLVPQILISRLCLPENQTSTFDFLIVLYFFHFITRDRPKKPTG